MKLTFQLNLTTDYHIGAGHGLGSQVDAALLRDGDGLPVLRGSAIEGLLRDGMWRLLQTPPLATHYEQHRDEEKRRRETGDEVAAWCVSEKDCPLCRVFGTPGAPKRWRISSARPEGANNFLTPDKSWKAGQTGAQIAARVRVNPRLRRAEERKLFKQEEGDARLSFTFTAECGDDERTLDEAALLAGAARMVRHIGSARRRGRGECSVRLLNAEANALTDALSTQIGLLGHFKAWLEGDAQRLRLTPATAKWEAPTAQNAEQETKQANPIRRWLLIRLDEPLLVAKRAQAGNEFETVEQIPGVAVLGALAARAAGRWTLPTDGQGDLYQAFIETFKNGAVWFGTLHPTGSGSTTLTPAIPTPLDLLTCKVYPGFDDGAGKKAHGAKGYAAADHAASDCQVCRERDGNSDIPLVQFDGFHSVKAPATKVQLLRREEMHPRLHPHTQRVARGNLFGYVALESGQFLLGEIRCQNADAWATLLKLIGLENGNEAFQLRLGKATRRGYGLVSARLLEPKHDYLWRGKSLVQRVDADAKRLTFTLLSDAIVPDVWGRSRQTLDGAFLQELIGEQFVAADNPIQAFCKTRFVDNFNNQLGLPRWRDVAIRAGSAVGIRLQEPPAEPSERKEWFDALLKRLGEIEEGGIGLRRNEGFGQVVFNHPIYEGGAGVSDTTINIPKDWRPAQSHTEGFVKTVRDEEKEIGDWRHKKFNETFFRESSTPTNEEERNWTAVARWLHSSADEPITTLQLELAKFEQQKAQPNLLTGEPREKESFFAKDRNKKALDYLMQLLIEIGKEIEKKEYSAELRRVLVEMLAQRLAESVKKGEN